MRGSDAATGSLLSDIAPGSASRYSIRCTGRKLNSTCSAQERSPFQTTDPLRAATHGADGLQPAVSLGRVGNTVQVPTVRTKNLDRQLVTAMSRRVMATILSHREAAPLLSDDPLPVDGTRAKARATSDAGDDPGDPPCTSSPDRSEAPGPPPSTADLTGSPVMQDHGSAGRGSGSLSA